VPHRVAPGAGARVIGKRAQRHRMRDDEARAADQMTRPRIDRRAVIAVAVEEAAARVAAAAVAERERLQHMPAQERGAAE
jgi:hypothetical protein